MKKPLPKQINVSITGNEYEEEQENQKNIFRHKCDEFGQSDLIHAITEPDNNIHPTLIGLTEVKGRTILWTPPASYRGVADMLRDSLDIDEGAREILEYVKSSNDIKSQTISHMFRFFVAQQGNTQFFHVAKRVIFMYYLGQKPETENICTIQCINDPGAETVNVKSLFITPDHFEVIEGGELSGIHSKYTEMAMKTISGDTEPFEQFEDTITNGLNEMARDTKVQKVLQSDSEEIEKELYETGKFAERPEVSQTVTPSPKGSGIDEKEEIREMRKKYPPTTAIKIPE